MEEESVMNGDKYFVTTYIVVNRGQECARRTMIEERDTTQVFERSADAVAHADKVIKFSRRRKENAVEEGQVEEGGIVEHPET